MLDSRQIKSFQKKILGWYEKNKRDLPWRDAPLTTNGRSGASLRDPYKILISEVMLQQTQVSRVIPKYEEWLKAFPNIGSLGKASTRDVLLHWSGLGYNRRALFLKKCAETLVHQSSLRGETTKQSQKIDRHVRLGGLAMTYRIVWPETEEELRKFPGIGEYTARAILCFAFNKQVAVVDTNVRKVILTNFQFPIFNFQINSKTQISNKEIQEIADELLPKGRAYEWNQALMDYAAAELKGVHPSTSLRIKKQSAFLDSDRYYRGQILKYMIFHKKISQRKLYAFFSNKPTLTEERFEKILAGLQNDGLIQKKGKYIDFL